MTLAFQSGQSATAAPYLEDSLRYLPDVVRQSLLSLQSYLNKTAASAPHTSSLASTIGGLVVSLPRSVCLRYLPFLAASPVAFAATLLAVLLALITIMAGWRQWPSMLSGIASPLAGLGRIVGPQVREGDFEYVTPEEIRSSTEQRPRDPRYSPNQQYPNVEEDVGPDVIVLKSRDVFYPLQFQPYAIADGVLTIGALRRAAGHALATDRLRGVKLLYKGRLLKDDNATARSVNLKQRSEVLCVITDTYGMPDSASESSESDTARRLAICPIPPDEEREDQENNKTAPAGKRRATKNRNRRRKRQQPAQPQPDATTSTPGNQPSTNKSPTMGGPSPKLSSPPDNRQPPAARPSTNKPSSKPPPAGNASSRPLSKVPSPSPNINYSKSPKENLEMLEGYFESTIVPLCINYIRDPPTNASDQTKEYRLISETVMTQVMLKADNIEIDGDANLRQQRKALILRVQSLLKKVDGVPKL